MSSSEYYWKYIFGKKKAMWSLAEKGGTNTVQQASLLRGTLAQGLVSSPGTNQPVLCLKARNVRWSYVRAVPAENVV